MDDAVFGLTPKKMLKGTFRPNDRAQACNVSDLVSEAELEDAHRKGGEVGMLELIEERGRKCAPREECKSGANPDRN
ncbi:hypothetical protein [Thioalkalivibrio sp. ALE16]|uniref:hypothetical protein n=1 Tax=Thioalkalivibrio sp. ALE16 TaxID=1158172 RepID=UPI00035FC9B1|nr:hypothetical protein [Thioalkalivibrio sp. ALE16]